MVTVFVGDQDGVQPGGLDPEPGQPANGLPLGKAAIYHDQGIAGGYQGGVALAAGTQGGESHRHPS